MADPGVNLRERRFHLDEDVIPGACFARTVPYVNHGRQITRNRDGLWFCSFTFDRNFRDRNWLALAVSKTPCTQGSDFPGLILLVGKDDAAFHPVFEYQGDGLGNSCLLMDGRDRLHVIFEQDSGLYRLTADAAGADACARLAEVSAWSGPELVAEKGAVLGDATMLPSGEIALYYVSAGTLYEKALGGRPTVVYEDASHPTVHVDSGGTRHVAFERDRRVFYVRSTPAGAWTNTKGDHEPEMVACFCASYPSIAATRDGRIVIAYQGEGKVDLKRNPALYSRVRPAGGSTVSYAVFADRAWRIHDFLRSSEILLKRRPSSSIPARDPEFVPLMEEFWRPSLAVDKHGVIWMFYLNTTRRHTYFARFMGRTFGDYFEARGAYDCLARTMFVQKDSRGQAAIGTLTLAADQFYFGAVDVPEYSSAEPRRVVFLDNLEVDEVCGLEHRLGTWRKHPEPVFGAGISGDSEDDHIAWCEVLKVPDGFEMHYMGQGRLRTNWMSGRAFSRDGIHWEKRRPFDETRLTLDGRPMPSRFWRPVYMEDLEEKDPAHRFKGVVGRYRHHRNIEIRSWDVVTSPDGLAWHTVPGLPVVLLGDISVSFHLMRDDEDRDPRRRYKMVLLMGASSGRAVVIFTSPDLIHWDGVYRLRENPESAASSLSPWPTGPIAIDPDAAESPWEEEVHDGVLWRENGILMLHYDAFYFGANQHINKALAVSRDGRRYYRIRRGAINMPHGNCGEWDSGRDRTCVPIRVGDEWWLYFCGMPAGCFADPDRDDPLQVDPRPPSPRDNQLHRAQRPWRVGLARLRVDGWAYWQRERDAARGHLTTIPFEYTRGRLVPLWRDLAMTRVVSARRTAWPLA